MYMSNIVFNPAALTHAGIYEAHRGLWKIFSDDPDRERDFLYRDMGQSSEAGPAFLAVSARPPGNRNLLAHCQIKSYAPRLSAGERLLFSLRVNPVRKTKEGKKQVRHDVVQDLRKRRMDEGIPKDRLPPRAVLAEEAGRDWLLERQKRLGLALEPESVISEAYTRERFSNAKGHRIVVGRLDLRGFATVTNPEALLKALYQGVGCAKGFGFGLLLVRRA